MVPLTPKLSLTKFTDSTHCRASLRLKPALCASLSKNNRQQNQKTTYTHLTLLLTCTAIVTSHHLRTCNQIKAIRNHNLFLKTQLKEIHFPWTYQYYYYYFFCLTSRKLATTNSSNDTEIKHHGLYL